MPNLNALLPHHQPVDIFLEMYKGKTISVVIPCLNEEEGIGGVIESIPDFVDEVLVVDNGSEDRSVEIATSLGARVVVEPRRGYGRAYRTGLESATSEIIATTDADGTYPIHLLAALLDEFEARKLDFASASRFPLERKDAMSLRNIVGNKIFTICARLLFSAAFNDILSGMWVFKREMLPKMRLESDGWSFSQDIKIEAFGVNGSRCGEIRIPYAVRLGQVKLPAWRAGVSALVELFLRRLRDRRRRD